MCNLVLIMLVYVPEVPVVMVSNMLNAVFDGNWLFSLAFTLYVHVHNYSYVYVYNVVYLGAYSVINLAISWSRKFDDVCCNTVVSLCCGIEDCSVCIYFVQLWDIGGQPRFRSMWERYCRGVTAIVWVKTLCLFHATLLWVLGHCAIHMNGYVVACFI